MIEQIITNKAREVKSLRSCPYKRTKPILKPDFSDTVNIIAELKSKSPSFGNFNVNMSNLIEIYSKYAKAISVLTDSKYFGGSFEFLHEVSRRTNLPILCKDFIIDKKQIDWAAAAGADIVLLIARVLDKGQLKELYDYTYGLGLEALVEVHRQQDLHKIEFKPHFLGVNARDLDTLNIDKKAAKEMLSKFCVPVKIAESGIRNRPDVEFFLPVANVFLIGEALLKSSDIEATFKELLCL
ncbi:Indole-3-glycerol phosphate synthase [Desulfurella amilsii]|uniref:indole-3-glycerol-phosphate synthase n=1 Tax=Desulfurella amilsii TaxID=1562698 RepID=A0A1X4XW45_9BACT|nr:indole-3-glycerol phosphate synthase TrpC [Desulfurella amilsii]OSS41757.1 Indole-3-glycerol phosphate synthase [Desulfurella amilsii]